MAFRRGRGRPPRIPRPERTDVPPPPPREEPGQSGSSDSQMIGEVHQLLRGLTETVAQLVPRAQAGSSGQVSPALQPDPQPVAEDERSARRMRMLLDFSRLQPPTFKGEPNPAEAEAWLRKMKKLLDLARIPEDSRVAIITSFLEGEADFWWESVMRDRDIDSMTWGQFEDIFYGKYFGQAAREAKIQEFMSLTQGSMTVAQYEAKFSELARFAPEVVATEEMRARKFGAGLRLAIRSRLMPMQIREYSIWVERALLVEQDREEYVRSLESSRKKVRSPGFSYQSQGPRPRPPPPSASFQRSVPPRSGLQCFECGQMGHIRRFCPNRGRPSLQQSQTQSVWQYQRPPQSQQPPQFWQQPPRSWQQPQYQQRLQYQQRPQYQQSQQSQASVPTRAPVHQPSSYQRSTGLIHLSLCGTKAHHRLHLTKLLRLGYLFLPHFSLEPGLVLHPAHQKSTWKDSRMFLSELGLI